MTKTLITHAATNQFTNLTQCIIEQFRGLFREWTLDRTKKSNSNILYLGHFKKAVIRPIDMKFTVGRYVCWEGNIRQACYRLKRTIRKVMCVDRLSVLKDMASSCWNIYPAARIGCCALACKMQCQVYISLLPLILIRCYVILHHENTFLRFS